MAPSPAIPHPGVRFPPPLLFVAGLLGGWLLERNRPLPIVSAGRPERMLVLGWALVVVALLGMGWAIRTFVRARTAIFPNQPASRIVSSGPFRFSRNPMYVAMTSLYLGLTMLMNSVWPLLFLPLALGALFVLVIQREERYLQSAFGEDYAAYRRRVRRWL